MSYDVIVDFTGDTELVSAATELIAPHSRVVNLIPFQRYRQPLLFQSKIRKSAHLVADGIVDSVVTEVVTLDRNPDLLQRIAAGDPSVEAP